MSPNRRRRRLVPVTLVTLALVAAAMLVPPSSSLAVTVVLGPPSLGAASPEMFECSGCQSNVVINTAATIGAQVRAPADGTIGSWGIRGEAIGGGSLQLFTLHPQGEGSLEDGLISANAVFTDGTPNPTSLTVTAGDTIGVFLSRGIDFAKEHARIATAAAPGASWGQLGYYTPGRKETPFEIVAGAQALYSASVELLAPEISAISPSSGVGGTVVTITGRHLAVATGVSFNGVPAAAFSGDDEHLSAVAPPRLEGGTVDIGVMTAGGTTAATSVDRFTYPTLTTTLPVVAPADHTPPVIGSLSLAPASFRAANLGGSVIASRVGTRISELLSEPATITFSVQRILAGRRSGKRCLAPTKRNRAKRRCTRTKSVRGSFARAGVAGANSFTFTGRVGGKALRPGSYRLVAVAVDAAGNRSIPAARAFSIVR